MPSPGRPPFPTNVSGPVYIWTTGAELLPDVRPLEFRRAAAATLEAGGYVFTFDGLQVVLSGVMLGRAGVREEQRPLALDVPELGGMPTLVSYGVAVESRLPGLSIELGMCSQHARDRRWLVCFGPEDIGVWGRRFRLGDFYRVGSGVLKFTSPEGRATLRQELFEQAKKANEKWRSS